MNVLEVLAGLLRRWYITVPGLILAAAAAFGMWSVTSPEYVRSASQLLLPGDGVLPEGATNQFLYIGGLGPVADVLARAVNGDDTVREYTEAGADVVVVRDTSISGPVILLTVTAASSDAARDMIDSLTQLTAVTLNDLQAEQGIRPSDRVTVATISVDTTDTVSQRSRLIPTGAVAVIIVLLTLVSASIVDGLMTKSRRRHLSGNVVAGASSEDSADTVGSGTIGMGATGQWDVEMAAESEVAVDPEVAEESEVAMDPEVAGESEVTMDPEVAAEPEVAIDADRPHDDTAPVRIVKPRLEATVEPAEEHEAPRTPRRAKKR